MRTRFVFYVLVLAGLALAQISIDKTNVSTGPQFQVAGSASGGVMMPPTCKDATCGQGGTQKSNLISTR